MVVGAKTGMNWRRAILAGTALVLMAAGPASTFAIAQDAPAGTDSFRLQPATPTAAPPVIAPPPPPIPPSPTPTATASATPRATPTPRTTATSAPRPTASPSPRPAPAPAPGPTASPTPLPPLASPVPEALPSLASEPAAPAAQPTREAPLWPWLAGAAAIVVLGGGAFLLRRRRAGTETEYFEEEAPVAPAPAPEVSPPAALPRRTTPTPPPAPAPTPLPEPALSLDDVPPPPPVRGKAGETLAVQLVARRLSATLMNTALTYELTVTNTGAEPIGPIAVTGDMIGAHSSIPPKVLLETAGDSEPQHRVPLLGPGESASMSGELRLPLASITPIRHGAATLFVPLARFRVLVFRDGRPPVSSGHAFVIGEEPQTPGAALKPFRLDLGPRLYSGITQRELALPT